MGELEHLWKRITNCPTDKSSPSATSVSEPPRPCSSPLTLVWNLSVSTRPPTTPSCTATWTSERTCTPTSSCPVVRLCSPVLLIVCRRSKSDYDLKFGKKDAPEIDQKDDQKNLSKKCPKPNIWIPSRDTLLTIQRKNRFENGQRPATTGQAAGGQSTAWYPPSSLARAPPVNDTYPVAPKTSVKLIQNRPKAKSNSFYLHEYGKEKAQTIHLTSSCKPPPVIPSGLKIVQNETLDCSAA